MENAVPHLERKHPLFFRHVEVIESVEVQAPAVHRTNGATEVVAKYQLAAGVIADARNRERHAIGSGLAEKYVTDRMDSLGVVGKPYAQRPLLHDFGNEHSE